MSDQEECPYCKSELTVDFTHDGYFAMCCNHQCKVMPVTNDDNETPSDAFMSLTECVGVTSQITGMQVNKEEVSNA